MADRFDYEYPSPMAGYEDLPPLSEEMASDGKSYINPPSTGLSKAYERFPSPIQNTSRGGFDIHIYFQQNDTWQTQYATQLWQRIRHEFPELRIYKLWDAPIGPHPLAMFEVNVFTPAQFGAFVSWLVVWRGPLSVLVHPNTDDEVRDHSQRASWLGPPVLLNMRIFKEIEEKRKAREAQQMQRVETENNSTNLFVR